MRAMSPRESRLVAVLVLLALVALVMLAIVYPIANGFAERAAERDRLALRFALDQRLIASIPRLRRAAEQQRVAVSRYVATGVPARVAAEQLQDRVGSAVEASGGEIRSVEGSVESDRIRARLALSANLPQLLEIVRKIQDGQPYATIDTLTITADQALISGKPDIMDVTFDVSIPYLAR
jgi:general secretion pathway protein M